MYLWPQWRPLDDLDTGAPGIGDVGDGIAVPTLANRLVELDAFRFDLLQEGLVVLHIKTDVVQNTTTRRCLLRIALSEPNLCAWDVYDRRVIAGARLPTKGLRIPSLSFRDFCFRQK